MIPTTKPCSRKAASGQRLRRPPPRRAEGRPRPPPRPVPRLPSRRVTRWRTSAPRKSPPWLTHEVDGMKPDAEILHAGTQPAASAGAAPGREDDRLRLAAWASTLRGFLGRAELLRL